ncbi:cyanophycin synthetase [Oligoflexus tunisiensis]|uniref:cyanophycin synthetase n=1 Tax=Oligoflexus tunisiensis TaxID=708132 RepID=UPI000AF3991A|nr:cyanophycin synthetase [Oligoflexus tunisiensis]
MNILKVLPIRGPNVFTHRPVMTMKLDLGPFTDVESKDCPGFNERLLALLPGLHSHRCSRGHPGGFVERLQEGTYFGHIIEHVALELSGPAGREASYGKTVYAGEPGVYRVVIECEIEELSEFLLRTAVDLVQALLQGERYSLEEKFQEGQAIVKDYALGPSTQAIANAAKRRGIPVQRLNDGNLLQLGYGRHRQYVQATEGWSTRAIAVDIACDKALTKKFLRDAHLPVPSGTVVRTVHEALQTLKEFTSPLVVKPLDGRQGKGVSLQVRTPEELIKAFTAASDYASAVVIEEMFQGHDYRVLVINGKMVAASQRLPPRVFGDGVHTVAELVVIENQNPLRGEGHEKPLTQIICDAIALNCLQRQGYELDSIPAVGSLVWMRDSHNLSTGGTARDVTDEVHPQTRRICERAAATIGLDICGIDLIADDISQPLTAQNGIIEINAAPGIRMHLFPSEGKSRDVGQAIVAMMFPEGHQGRIPIIAVTGTNGKTTTSRMISQIFCKQGLNVGRTTTGGIWIGNDKIASGDTTGPHSARSVLSDPTVDLAVLECARGGLMREGLAYDWSDVGVITNIQCDHFGQDGIEDEEDILHVKSLIADRVKAGGTVVLNAADPYLIRIQDHPRFQKIPRSLVYFALDAANPVIRQHLRQGGTAYYVKHNWVIEARGPGLDEARLVALADLPCTWGGRAGFQVENVLAAIAVARSQGVERDVIASALREFRSDRDNPGRMNCFRIGTGQVLLDFGHNPAAITALGRAARHGCSRLTGIVGVPGDRINSLIEQSGEAAGREFDRLILREDQDRRGREPGHVAEILLRAVRRVAPEKDCRIMLDELQALEFALDAMIPGETIVVFFEHMEAVTKRLFELGAVPMEVPLPQIEVDSPREVDEWRQVPMSV